MQRFHSVRKTVSVALSQHSFKLAFQSAHAGICCHRILNVPVLFSNSRHMSMSTPSSSSVQAVENQSVQSNQRPRKPKVPDFKHQFDAALVHELLLKSDDEQPVKMLDPYAREHSRCFMCRENIEVNYKNVRLLSQFVSPYTGRIYNRQITGLCIPMQNHVEASIRRARATGFMAVVHKDTRYYNDPKPYEPANNKIKPGN